MLAAFIAVWVDQVASVARISDVKDLDRGGCNFPGGSADLIPRKFKLHFLLFCHYICLKCKIVPIPNEI